MRTHRLYVRKCKAARIREQEFKKQIRAFLNIDGITELAIYRRYLSFAELTDEEWFEISQKLLIEQAVDQAYSNESFLDEYDHFFAMGLLPAQFDPAAQACEEGAMLIIGRRVPISCAEVIAIKGSLSQDKLNEIKDYFINPIESQEYPALPPFSQPKTELENLDIKQHPELLECLDEDISEFKEKMELGLSEADLIMIRDYFIAKDRVPNELELRVLDTYWSDHCRHGSFNADLQMKELISETDFTKLVSGSLNKIEKERRELGREGALSLMEIATLPMRIQAHRGELSDVEFSEEINAATLKRKLKIGSETEDYLILFKNETHNHPTEIEPDGGAATCLGGAIRDPLSGRGHVFQAMRVSGAADPNTNLADTLPGKLPQRKICQEAAAGFSAYGNRMGLASSHIREYYHPNFVAKRFECGAVLAAVPAADVRKLEPAPGDIVLLVGGDTGRDGIGGATGSSREQDEDSLTSAGSEVQKGNPIEERKLQRLFMRPEFTRLIKRCNDFGAGGVSVAVGELARGLEIDLSAVPLKYQGLNPLEIALSESQERMAVVVSRADADEMISLAREEAVKATAIAVVQEDPVLSMKYDGEEVLRLDRSFLDSAGARQTFDLDLNKLAKPQPFKSRPQPQSFMSLCAELFSDLNSASQRGLQEIFDYSVGQTTVAAPYGGEYESSPEMGICAKLPGVDKSNSVVFMTHGYDPYVAENSPWHGALFAITTALLKLLALGGDPRKARLSLQEYFPRLDQEKNIRSAVIAMLSAYRALREFKVPAIGGKDSVSGTYQDINVPTTVVAFAVDSGELSQYRQATLSSEGEYTIYAWNILDSNYDIDFERYRSELPAILSLLRSPDTVGAFIGEADGMLGACARAAFGNRHGLKFSPDLSLEELSRPAFGSLYVIRKSRLAPVELRALNLQTIASSSKDGKFHFELENMAIERIQEYADDPLSGVYPLAENSEELRESKQDYFKAKLQERPSQAFNMNGRGKLLMNTKPKVLIPCFPGSNCEFDTARAFELAGADTEIFIINNLEEALLQKSLKEMAEALESAEILALPGGFSAGDEPDGAAKYIRAVFLNDKLRSAFDKHIAKDNLVLGICNGFQALVKLGVFKNNTISETNAEDITLTFNNKGSHIARCARTNLISKNGPWLARAQENMSYKIPISHGEGRLIGSEKELDRLVTNGQVAFVYADDNPNGSALGIEALTSPNGLILGKMGHSERVLPGLLQNIPDMKNEGIFEAAVDYFLTN